MRIAGLQARMMVAALCVGAALWFGAGRLSAAEEAGERQEAKPTPQKTTLLDTLNKAGTIGWIIVGLSVVALALAVEHAITIRRGAMMPMQTMLQIRALVKKGAYDDLRTFCEKDPSMVAKVIGAAVAEPRSSYEDIEEAMMETGSEETARLYRKIEFLSVIANIATMLGLLGTVAGMIMSFDTIAQKGGFAKPAELAGGIAMALITTYQGLVVAIPSLVAYAFFRNRVEQISGEVSALSEELMRPVRRRAQRKNEEAKEEGDED